MKNMKFTVLDTEEVRGARQMMAWADAKIALAQAGVIFDVPAGHDTFMVNVYKVREDAENVLLENLALKVIA